MNEERHYDYMQRWGRHVAAAQGINSVAGTGNGQRQKYKHRRDNMHPSIPRLTDCHSPRTTNHKAQVVQRSARISKSDKIQKHRMLRFPQAVSSYFAGLFHGGFQTQKDTNAPRDAFPRRKCLVFCSVPINMGYHRTHPSPHRFPSPFLPSYACPRPVHRRPDLSKTTWVL